jgi:hypothetical protein
MSGDNVVLQFSSRSHAKRGSSGRRRGECTPRQGPPPQVPDQIAGNQSGVAPDAARIVRATSKVSNVVILQVWRARAEPPPEQGEEGLALAEQQLALMSKQQKQAALLKWIVSDRITGEELDRVIAAFAGVGR